MYFLIYHLENGLQVKQFQSSDSIKEYLEEYFTDEPIKFLNRVPDDIEEIYYGYALIIKGEIIIPKGVEIIKSYEID